MTSKQTIIFSAPQGWGKTTRAQQLSAVYGCKHVVDEWRPGEALQPGALHLTNVHPSKITTDKATVIQMGWHRSRQGPLRVYARGKQIDIQSRENGVIHLVVRADQQHRSLVGRIRQYLACALFRAGDLCHPGNHHSAIRVVKLPVPDHAVNDGAANGRNSHPAEVIPLHTSDGDAHYQALIVYEGVKEHGDRLFAFHDVALWPQERADDAHGNLHKTQSDFLKQAVILPDSKGGAA